MRLMGDIKCVDVTLLTSAGTEMGLVGDIHLYYLVSEWNQRTQNRYYTFGEMRLAGNVHLVMVLK